MYRLVPILALAACSFRALASSDDGGIGFDTPDGKCPVWNTLAGHVQPCDVPPGPAWNVPPGGSYDTTTGTMLGGPSPNSYVRGGMRVVSVDAFTLSDAGTLRVVGSLPLVILSWSTITMAGTLDASSKRSGLITGPNVEPGPGANGPLCTTVGVGSGGQDAGGGGGGGFRGSGGAGGHGSSNNTGGTGGASIAAPKLVGGGCAGTDGGTSNARGRGGAGGGAIQLTAKTAIAVTSTGKIDAGGAGGGGANGDGGGGGGGSGGYIGLDAPSIMLDAAVLAANGGGGGTGCDNSDKGPQGENGKLGTQQALGGMATCLNGAAGGSGGAMAPIAGATGSNGTAQGSAGGGGGGGGFILAWGTMSGQAVTSPTIDAGPR